MRDAYKARTGGTDLYIVGMSHHEASDRNLVNQLDADAAGAYALTHYDPSIVSAETTRNRPYADIDAINGQHAASWASRRHQVVPLVMSGWDPRPRWENTMDPVCYSDSRGWYTNPTCWDGYGFWYTQPTPLQLECNLRARINWVNATPSFATARSVLIYAWNEFDEGGWLAPTYTGDGHAGDASRLNAVGRAISGVTTCN
jgi:hypothetical protein